VEGVDIMDLGAMVAVMAVVLVIVEEAMVVVGQDMGIKVVDMVVVEEDVMLTMKEGILVAVTMVAMGTIMNLEIILDNSSQMMGP
jgi:hypothetical protein